MNISAIAKNPVVRNVVLGTMLAGSALAAQAASSNSSARVKEPASTHIMSSAAASALAASQLASTPSFEHSKKMDEKVFSMTPPEELESDKKVMDELYSTYGTYLAVMWIQGSVTEVAYTRACDAQLADLKNKGYSKYGEELTKKEVAFYKDSKLPNYMDRRNSSLINFINSQTSVAGYDQCSSFIDSFAEDVFEYMPENKDKYKQGVRDYLKNVPSRSLNTVQGKADYLAYKMFLVDSLYLAPEEPMYSIERFNRNFDFKEYFDNVFMKLAKP